MFIKITFCLGSDRLYGLEMDRIRMRIAAREALRMRIPVSRHPQMRIFVTYLNNTSYCQMGAAFVIEYRLLHYAEY